MDKRYITLFKDLAQVIAATAETVMEYDSKKDDKTALEAATLMRDRYQELNGKIKDAGDNYVMDKMDAANLLIGATIQVTQLQTKLETYKKAMQSFQTDLIPKLQAIVDAEDDEAAAKLAEEKFIISET